jgi:hypothetical protein
MVAAAVAEVRELGELEAEVALELELLLIVEAYLRYLRVWRDIKGDGSECGAGIRTKRFQRTIEVDTKSMLPRTF